MVKIMEKIQYLKNAINLIEENISTKIYVEQLARECYVSPRQFYRDFYSITGHTINEYIRKRRLSKSLNFIRYTKMSIIDIAYHCGYSSEAALCKTIKYYINMTPTEYRNSSYQYYFPVFNCDDFMQIEIKTEKIPKTLSILYYQTQLIGIESRAVAYWYSIAPHYKGRIFGRNEMQKGNQFCYEIMIEHSDDIINLLKNKNISIYKINPSAEGQYATTTVNNSEKNIIYAWDYLYNYWMKYSMFEQDVTPYFEEYVRKKDIVTKLILYLPVITRIHYFRINIVSCEDRLFIVSTKKGVNSEKLASNDLVSFIVKQYPYLLESQKEYYVCKENVTCTCGIRINESRYISNDGSISLLTIPKGFYAVVEGACFGGSEYEFILRQWVKENGYEPIDAPFTIYDVSKGRNKKEVVVQSFIRLKWQKNIRKMKV